MKPLQMEMVTFVADYQREHGYPPTLREIAAAMGHSIGESVTEQVKRHIAAGNLEGDPRIARTVRVAGSRYTFRALEEPNYEYRGVMSAPAKVSMGAMKLTHAGFPGIRADMAEEWMAS